MKKSIIFSFLMLFSACATPHIEHTQDNLLRISVKDTILIKGEGEPLYKNTIRLLNLTIKQTVFLMDDETILIYEDAFASAGYKYNYGIKKTVSIIFPSYSYELIDIKGNIHFFKLKSKYEKQKTEYLILENMNKKRIKMIYGLEKNLFDTLLSLLEENDPSIVDKYTARQSAKIFKNKSMYIKSTWNIKSSVLNNLVAKVGRRIR